MEQNTAIPLGKQVLLLQVEGCQTYSDGNKAYTFSHIQHVAGGSLSASACSGLKT